MDYPTLVARLEKQRDDAIDGWRRSLDLADDFKTKIIKTKSTDLNMKILAEYIPYSTGIRTLYDLLKNKDIPDEHKHILSIYLDHAFGRNWWEDKEKK
jgi:hypothetical protein